MESKSSNYSGTMIFALAMIGVGIYFLSTVPDPRPNLEIWLFYFLQVTSRIQEWWSNYWDRLFIGISLIGVGLYFADEVIRKERGGSKPQ